MENGTRDGIVTCPSMIQLFGLDGVARHCTLVTFGCVGEGLFMNQDAWERTPEDLKGIIEEVCENPYRTTGGMTKGTYDSIIAELNESGVVFTSLPPEEEARWHAAFSNVTREWVAELEAEGASGEGGGGDLQRGVREARGRLRRLPPGVEVGANRCGERSGVQPFDAADLDCEKGGTRIPSIFIATPA